MLFVFFFVSGDLASKSLVPKFEKMIEVSDPAKVTLTHNPLPQYLKEKIERRRIEAKKRLFSKKYKSL